MTPRITLDRSAPPPSTPEGARWIPLGHDRFVLVDESDYEQLSRHRWYLSYYGYATRNRGVLMHREILSSTPGSEVDHINRDKLDNRRSNLRLATHAQNMANEKLRVTNSSGFRGVSRTQKGRPWQAHIRVNSKSVYLGRFPTPEEAALAYDLAALKTRKEFARTNYVPLDRVLV